MRELIFINLVLYFIIFKMPFAPSELNPEAKEVDHIVLRCLMKKKEERYQNAEELQTKQYSRGKIRVKGAKKERKNVL